MSPEISGVQGSVSQVREVTAELMQIAKTNNIATFIVGHVTKEGQLAGPRMLEHMVDTVLSKTSSPSVFYEQSKTVLFPIVFQEGQLATDQLM